MKAIFSTLSAALSLVLCTPAPAATCGATSGHLTFELLETDIGDAGWREARRIFTSPAEYQAYFGHLAPSDVNWSTEWVVYYAAGMRPTGGYVANILDVDVTEGGRSLRITTSLASPGPNCPVTQSISRPYVLAAFAKPPRRPSIARFACADEEVDCKE